MSIDLNELDPEAFTYFVQSVNNMPETMLIDRAKPMKDLFQGLRQDKPNINELRQRAIAKMKLKKLPPPVLELLRSATLADALIKVLSEKALTAGNLALYEKFGRNEILFSMLLDERETIQNFAKSELAKSPKEKIKPEDTFKHRFEPLINLLVPIIRDEPYIPPKQQNSNTHSATQTLTKEQEDKLIRASSLFKQTFRDRNDFEASVKKISNELEGSNKKIISQSRLIKELEAKVISLETYFNQRIAEGIADGLNARIAPWFETTEKLSANTKHQTNCIAVAEHLISQQESADKRFGTRSRIKTEIEDAKALQIKLKSAQVESLRPLPGLAEAIRSLENHIESLEKLLTGSSIEPINPKLKVLLQELQVINSLDELNNKKKSIEKTMELEVWGIELCKQAFSLVEREAQRIYSSHIHSIAKEKDDEVVNTPHQLIEYCLRNAKPLRLMIDGHNMLPKIKPFIGGQYFSEGKGPTIGGRKLLIDRVRILTERQPLIEADVWFDGPVQEDWTESKNLRVWFSGGKGSDRADKKILEGLQSLDFLNKNEFRFLVTEDRDLLHKAKALKAVGVSPIEMWSMLN